MTTEIKDIQLETVHVRIFNAIDKFMDVPAINAARHADAEADVLACEIERLMTSLGLYGETGEFLTSAAALLGKRGGSATSEAKAIAARANGKRGGRRPKAK